MESARLTAAHALLSEASRAPSSVERHHAVANEFAKTAETTTDSEALRVLRLLEQEHRRLARLVEQRSASKDAPLDESTAHTAADTAARPLQQPVAKPDHEPPIKRQSSPTIERRPAKPLSSSIANNLASARGIPTVQQRHARTSSSGRPRSSLMGDAKAGATTASSDASAAGRSSKPPSPGASVRLSEDEGFNRFYANFEGLWSRLSAPLAFAGLPLIPESTTAPTTSTEKEGAPEEKRPPVTTARHHEGPDLNSIYSRAALKAIRDEHGSMGVHESFFVVPTTGGTMSYAKMAARDDEDDDEFEDARESVSQTASPRLSRQTSRVQPANLRGSRTGKTMEELETENASLKQLTDTLSKRLYTWEKNAQHQTMQLQQSIRSLHPLHPLHAHGAEAVDESPRVKELEEQLRAARHEVERGGREIDKLQTVVGRYRERWEKLKEGARSRRETAEAGPG